MPNPTELSNLQEVIFENGDDILFPTKTYFSIRIFDFLFASLLLFLISPVMLLVSLCIFLFDGLPILFTQKRPGLEMKSITMPKFRTMNVGSELTELDKLSTLQEPNVQTENDKRVTKLGKRLRKLSLDELPQLFLVIRGDMSLVGPRPLIQAEVDHFPQHYLRRYRVLPGISGLAQVSGRADLSVWEILELDLEWVEKYSLVLYFKILLKTLYVVLNIQKAR